jgi:H+-transporting ATPase
MTVAPPVAAPAEVAVSANEFPNGLTSDEARRRFEKSGPNSMPDTVVNPLRRALTQFWSPIPWMLEAAIVLELVLGKFIEAGIISVLLVFNAALGFFQEGRAQATLATLKSRLALTASVRRDGVWKNLPAAELVPDDMVKLSLGGVVAADVKLTEGNVLLDQSMLTGESIGTEAGPGFQSFAGALVRRGEAVAQVTATGIHTKFGRTAELVRTAHVVSSQQKAVVACGAQSRGVQWHSDYPAGDVCADSGHADERDHPLGFNGDSGFDSRGAPGHLHAGERARRTRLGKPWRLANPALGCGRGCLD